MIFNYTHMKIAHLFCPQLIMSSIGNTSLVGSHWVIGGLRVNSSPVKAGLIIFPLFLLEGNAILPSEADCEWGVNLERN